MSTVFRAEKNGSFTIMSNYHLKDRRLTYKAKGLLSEMLSLPPDRDYTPGGLAVIANDGIDSVRSAIKEPEKYGYLVRFQRRDERGRMSVNEYAVYENPEPNPNYTPPESANESDNAAQAAPKKCSAKRRTSSTKTIERNADFSRSPSSENPITKNQIIQSRALRAPTGLK